MERLFNGMVGQKLDLLESNLNKKATLLKKMADVLNEQLQLLDTSDMQLEELDVCMEKQDSLTEELEALNEEADTLYEYLQTKDGSFDKANVPKIARIQELLSQLTNDFDTLQEKELRVKKQMEKFLHKERKNFGTGRRSSKAALDYYMNMSGSTMVPPQFMDRKK